MRLDELITKNQLVLKPRDVTAGLDQGEDDGFYDFKKMLVTKGFSCNGSGGYAVVFSHPSLDYVIKAFNTQDDDGYLGFIEYCRSHPGNPHLPVFRGKPVQVDHKWACCRLEALQALDYRQSNMLAIISRRVAERRVDNPEQIYSLLGDMLADQAVVLGFDETFIQTLIDLYRASRELGLRFDVRSGNVMRRGATLVVTDPFATA